MMVLVCKPLGTKLTRSACGARHEAAARDGEKRAPGNSKVSCSTCATCTIGRAHHAGDRPEFWPDGTPIEIVEIEAAKTEHVGPPRPMPTKPRSRYERASFEKPTPVAAPRPLAATPTRSKIEPVPDAPEPPANDDAGDDVEPVSLTGDTPAIERPAARRDHRPRPVVRDGDAGESAIVPARGRLVEVDGVSRSISEWAKLAGINPNAVYERIRRGWPLALACTAPRGATYENASPVGISGRPRLGSSPIATLPDVDDADTTPEEGEPDDEPRSEGGLVGDVFSKLFGAAPLSPRAVLEAAGFEVVSAGPVPAGTMLVVRRRR